MQDPAHLDESTTDPQNNLPHTDNLPTEDDRDVITEELTDDPTETLQVPPAEQASELDGLATDETEQQTDNQSNDSDDDKRNYVEDLGPK